MAKTSCSFNWSNLVLMLNGYYNPDSYWPKGRIFPTDNKIFSDVNCKFTKLNYLNVFGLRSITKKFF